MNYSEDSPNQPSILHISPTINFYQFLQLLFLLILTFLLLELLTITTSGTYIIMAIVLTIIIILYWVHTLSVFFRRITVTPTEIIDKQGFLSTNRIMRHTIADCRVVMNDVFDERSRFRKSPIQEEVLILLGRQGEIVGKIDVSAFADRDIKKVVSALKSNASMN